MTFFFGLRWTIDHVPGRLLSPGILRVKPTFEQPVKTGEVRLQPGGPGHPAGDHDHLAATGDRLDDGVGHHLRAERTRTAPQVGRVAAE